MAALSLGCEGSVVRGLQFNDTETSTSTPPVMAVSKDITHPEMPKKMASIVTKDKGKSIHYEGTMAPIETKGKGKGGRMMGNMGSKEKTSSSDKESKSKKNNKKGTDSMKESKGFSMKSTSSPSGMSKKGKGTSTKGKGSSAEGKGSSGKGKGMSAMKMRMMGKGKGIGKGKGKGKGKGIVPNPQPTPAPQPTIPTQPPIGDDETRAPTPRKFDRKTRLAVTACDLTRS